MTSSKPYLLRAFYEWITENQCTPYIVVDTFYEGVQVPPEYVEDDRIILNIAPEAVDDLLLENTYVSFDARFSGTPYQIYIPMMAVSAVYAKENGRGMVFNEEYDDEPPPEGFFIDEDEEQHDSSSAKEKKGSHLTLVK